MEDSPEEPPTSCVLLESCHFSQVVFNNVEKFYVPGADVTCHYTLSQHIIPRGKDWVGIFRVGWKTTREYYTFLWAPVPAAGPGNGSAEQQLQFKAYYLPKDDEYYQFCYVDQDGMVRGASVPFQFRPEAEDDLLVVTTQGEVEEIELRNRNLQQENEELKGTCANLRERNLELQEELKKAQERQESLESLRSDTEKLELELESLKVENRELKEQGGCKEAELQRLKEKILDVTSDKERLEGRLRTALEHMDELQSQVSNYEADVENLSRVEQEKTKQLENVKGENQQLLQTTAQHQVQPPRRGLGREQLQGLLSHPCSGHIPRISRFLPQEQTRDLLKELEEQKLLFQALQAEKREADRKNQELWDENKALRGELSLLQGISPSPAGLEVPAPIPAPEPGDLLFGNPYDAAGGDLGAGAEASLRRCPMCGEVFPEAVGLGDYEAHVQSHLLECPVCGESFHSRQVFDDHVFCHGLE
ncbi:CACO2 protein, partial [Ptilonorhynchus violaceus]|nr:CACO2 protein [Ptilonorhynchus violaceus]